MQEQDSSTFQFGKNDDSNDAEIMQLELHELKMEKLSHRVTLLTILIPCIIGIILVIAYLDIKDRVALTQDTGTIGVQKLTKDIESKFSSLSLEQAKIKDALSKLPSLENSSSFIQSRLKSMQASLKELESSSISRDELSRVVERMNEKLGKIPSDLQTEMQELESTGNRSLEETQKLSGRLDTLSQSLTELQEDIKKLAKGISDMQEQKISKNELDLALKLKEIAYKQSLMETTSSMERKIKTLEEQIRVIQKSSRETRQNNESKESGASPSSKEGATGSQESNTNAGSPQPASGKPEAAPSPQPSSVQPQTITEQSIE